MTNLDSVLKSRDITLPTKGHLVKATVFPVVMYGCELGHKESWAPKNCCFWTVVLEKTLESPLDCKEIKPVHPKGDQSWIFIGRTDAEVPKAFGYLMRRTDSLEKTLMLGKIEGRKRGWQRMRWMDGIMTQWAWVWESSGSWCWTGKPGMLQSMVLQRVRYNRETELMQRANLLEKSLLLRKLKARGKRATEDEMVGWHHCLNGIEF